MDENELAKKFLDKLKSSSEEENINEIKQLIKLASSTESSYQYSEKDVRMNEK